MQNTTNPTLRLAAYFYSYGPGTEDKTRPWQVRIAGDLDTLEQAQEFAARFPKGAKITAHTVHHADHHIGGGVQGYATLERHVGLLPMEPPWGDAGDDPATP